MSDLHKLDQKVTQGRKWRGEIHVAFNGEEHTLKVRQLLDPEFREVLEKIDTEELEALKNDLPEDLTDEYRELSEKTDDLTEEEQDRLVELEEQLSSSENLFEKLSSDTLEAFRLCAKYAVVPDDEDIEKAFNNYDYVSQVEDEYGINVSTPNDLYNPAADGLPNKSAGPLKDKIGVMIDSMTQFASISVGMYAFRETMGANTKN